MLRRTVALVALAVVVAAVCVRLGFWQLSRLAGKRAENAVKVAQMRGEAGALDALPPGEARRFRRVRVEGRPDYEREIVLVGRSRDGSPGVNLVTPVRVAGRDTAVLVNRGWVYSPNAADVDFARWRERDTVAAEGWVQLPSRGQRAARLASNPRAYQWLDPAQLAQQLGYPVTTYYVVLAAAPGETPAPDRVARLPLPALDEGPHKSYAVQWFSFAAVAVVGAAAFARSERQRR